MQKRGQLTLFLIVGLVLVTLSYMTFLNLDVVNKPRIIEKTVVGRAMESCLEQLTIEGTQVVMIHAGTEPQEDNFPSKEEIPGRVKEKIEEYITSEFYPCLDTVLVSSVAHDAVKIRVTIFPMQITTTAKLSLLQSDKTTLTTYESASATVKFPLGDFLAAVESLKAGIENSIPQALILIIEEKYDVEIETWFQGPLVVYHFFSSRPPFSEENPLELFFTDTPEGFE